MRPADLPSFTVLGKRIKYWREQRKLSRGYVARKAGMAYSTLAGLEDGDQHTTTRITQLAAVLRVNPHYLSSDKGDPEDLSAPAPVESSADWPFSFDRSQIDDLDPNELALADLRIQKLLEEIRGNRVRPKRRKAQAKEAKDERQKRGGGGVSRTG